MLNLAFIVKNTQSYLVALDPCRSRPTTVTIARVHAPRVKYTSESCICSCAYKPTPILLSSTVQHCTSLCTAMLCEMYHRAYVWRFRVLSFYNCNSYYYFVFVQEFCGNITLTQSVEQTRYLGSDVVSIDSHDGQGRSIQEPSVSQTAEVHIDQIRRTCNQKPGGFHAFERTTEHGTIVNNTISERAKRAHSLLLCVNNTPIYGYRVGVCYVVTLSRWL